MFCYYVFSLLRSNLVTEECVLILWIKFHIFSPMDHLPGHRVLIVLKSVTPNHLLPLTMHTPTLNTVLFIFLEVNFVCSGFQINVYSFVSSWFCSARHFQRPEHGLQVSHFFSFYHWLVFQIMSRQVCPLLFSVWNFALQISWQFHWNQVVNESSWDIAFVVLTRLSLFMLEPSCLITASWSWNLLADAL